MKAEWTGARCGNREPGHLRDCAPCPLIAIAFGASLCPPFQYTDDGKENAKREKLPNSPTTKPSSAGWKRADLIHLYTSGAPTMGPIGGTATLARYY